MYKKKQKPQDVSPSFGLAVEQFKSQSPIVPDVKVNIGPVKHRMRLTIHAHVMSDIP